MTRPHRVAIGIRTSWLDIAVLAAGATHLVLSMLADQGASGIDQVAAEVAAPLREALG